MKFILSAEVTTFISERRWRVEVVIRRMVVLKNSIFIISKTYNRIGFKSYMRIFECFGCCIRDYGQGSTTGLLIPNDGTIAYVTKFIVRTVDL